MKAYADTNFFTRFYLPNPDLAEVKRLVAQYLQREEEPLPFTPLHRLEFRNALRLMAYRRKEPGELNLNPAQVRQVLRDNEADLAERAFMAPRAIDWTETLRQAEQISAAHTEKEGFRSLDLLHVGTAIHLGAEEFLTFDQDARRIAELAQLAVFPRRLEARPPRV
jgi:predicted nucleic acid-binding protein